MPWSLAASRLPLGRYATSPPLVSSTTGRWPTVPTITTAWPITTCSIQKASRELGRHHHDDQGPGKIQQRDSRQPDQKALYPGFPGCRKRKHGGGEQKDHQGPPCTNPRFRTSFLRYGWWCPFCSTCMADSRQHALGYIRSCQRERLQTRPLRSSECRAASKKEPAPPRNLTSHISDCFFFPCPNPCVSLCQNFSIFNGTRARLVKG